MFITIIITMRTKIIMTFEIGTTCLIVPIEKKFFKQTIVFLLIPDIFYNKFSQMTTLHSYRFVTKALFYKYNIII